ncbi:MAG TPA: pyridoxal phosphate-dependent aminotransferase [Gammaproteobacteria bacterium]|jgi:aspartate aminotransferase|nr:pyridoxal phosphate-dependent aminotransferase [Gammaproteobacteria bacterium]
MTTSSVKHQIVTLANRVERIRPSATLAISAKADSLQAEGKPIINLSVGEPDFDTPAHIKKAAADAMAAGHTRYTAVDGILPLRQAIVDKFAKENLLQYALNQVMVSCGAKHSLYNLFMALLNPGDEVLIVAPYWVSYPDMVKLADGVPIIIETHFADHFKLSPAQLEAAITPNTRMIILNSPSNPTGLSYTKAELAALGEVLLRHPQVFIASDDIYEHNLWNGTFCNILNACPALYDRCMVVNGVSKTYAMTGWRIGYVAGPANVVAAMKKAQSQSTSNPTSIAQYAALAALTGNQDCIQVMKKAYKERHDFLLGELQTIPGFDCIPSDGTFYTFPSIKALLQKDPAIHDDLTFSDFLLSEAEVAVVPGSAFGAPGHIRLCFTTSMDKLETAVKRIRQAVKRLA